MMQSLFDRFGRSIHFDGKYFSCFWEPSEILKSSGDELKLLKLGYRVKSLIEISTLFKQKKIDEIKLRKLSESEQERNLLSLPGIGIATAQYILCDCFHRYSELKHIPNWERKIYSQVFFKSSKVLPEKKLLNFLNSKFGEFTKLATHYFWADIWWRRERGEKIEWLEEEIRT
jgi:3-methyladenine DNA glycosylase/8-oxoguanine DNA glycosylase